MAKQKHNVQKPRNNGRGTPYDGFVGRLRPTGLPFSGFSYTVYERVGISLGRTNELNGVHVPFLLRMVYKKKGKGLYVMQSLPIENVFSPTPHPPRVDTSKGISIYLTGRMERLH